MASTRPDLKELDAKIDINIRELVAKTETARDFLRRDLKESELRPATTERIRGPPPAFPYFPPGAAGSVIRKARQSLREETFP